MFGLIKAPKEIVLYTGSRSNKLGDASFSDRTKQLCRVSRIEEDKSCSVGAITYVTYGEPIFHVPHANYDYGWLLTELINRNVSTETLKQWVSYEHHSLEQER